MMRIRYDKNVDYCIYLAALQSGKSFLHEGIEGVSIDREFEMFIGEMNVFSYCTVYENLNILGIHQGLTSILPKLNGCYMLEFDFASAALKHINDIIRNKGNRNASNKKSIIHTIDVIVNSHFYLLKFLRDNNIEYKKKNIISLPPGEVNIKELFNDEIEKYNLGIKNPVVVKRDYEWTHQQYFDAIEENLYKSYGIKQKFNSDFLFETLHKKKKKLIKLYNLDSY